MGFGSDFQYAYLGDFATPRLRWEVTSGHEGNGNETDDTTVPGQHIKSRLPSKAGYHQIKQAMLQMGHLRNALIQHRDAARSSHRHAFSLSLQNTHLTDLHRHDPAFNKYARRLLEGATRRVNKSFARFFKDPENVGRPQTKSPHQNRTLKISEPSGPHLKYSKEGWATIHIKGLPTIRFRTDRRLPLSTQPKLGFTHFKRRRRENLQVDGIGRPGVPAYQGLAADSEKPPTPATGGVAPGRWLHEGWRRLVVPGRPALGQTRKQPIATRFRTMADEGTHYSYQDEEPTPDEALEELDWASPEGPPVEEAATLIYAILNDPDAADGRETPSDYLECIINPENAVAAREALSHEPWNEDKRRETAEHEVHRMAYRLNLEIQDRLISQFQNDGHMARLARSMGLSQEIVEALDQLGNEMANDAIEYRQLESPTGEVITDQANTCLIHYAIENAAQLRDEAAVRELVPPNLESQELAESAQLATNYIDPALVNEIQAAIQTAARWDDDEILDGARDLHFEFTALDIFQTDAARAAWLSSRPDRMLRSEVVSDCVTRALNEATGGENYGPIWEDLTESIQTLDPNRDADSGIPPPHHRAIYEKYGMQLVLDTNEISDHPMRKHLDLREIPAMLGHLFDDPENPLTYIAGTEHHAVAVVDGTVHDIFDSRDIGDRTLYLQDGRLTELWIRGADEATLAEARDIIEKYTEARLYDDVLTYGRTRRLTTSGTTWR